MNIVAVVHARMGSTRLPGKSLLPLAGAPLVQHVLERVSRTPCVSCVVLAVPEHDHNEFRPAADAVPGVILYRHLGDESDVLGRIVSAATICDADVVIRIPADNPCVDPAYLDFAVERYSRFPFCYYSNTTDLCDGRWVDGVGGEVCSISRLRWLDNITLDDRELREHPHRYFEKNGMLSLPKADVRLDVNTPDEYDFIASIFTHFRHNRFTTAEVLAYLSQERLMSSV